MKSFRYLALPVASLSLLTLSCEGEGIFDRSLFHPTFKGITYTTEFGEITSQDPDDWQISTVSPYLDLFATFPVGEGERHNPLSGFLLPRSFTTSPTHASPADLPRSFAVSPAYPNPADKSIAFEYALPQTAPVLMFIIDSDRRIISTLVNGIYPAGRYRLLWEFRDRRGVRVPSNIYRCVYRLGLLMGYGDIWVK